ncbi:unnamed protein product [Somion occarium]|uniref:Transcription initiation factor IIF subunit alpha n=1 Tax=Somion occarium TaxID=3059160 RepID=A0ABP1D0W2_9APHY
MAPSAASVLFHPKKKAPNGNSVNGSSQNSNGSTSPRKPRIPRPRPKQEDEDSLTPSPPEGPYQEFRLMSSALNGWKYDVMKFESRKAVDITQWERPVMLNRKEPRREDTSATQAAPVPAGLMLGPDGKPVIGADGKPVQVDAEGRPIRPGEYSQGGGQGDKGKEKVSAIKKRMQKKTRQVHLIPEEVRQLRREERYPWVVEDGQKSEVWVGKMEEVSRSETHAMFMPAANDVFKFVPAHRWYKFQKKPHYRVPTLEEAESMMTQMQKNKDPERWLLRKRNGQGASDATAAMFKSEREGSAIPPSGSLVYSASQSLGPGGRRLRTVDSGMAGLFGDEDDEESGDRKRKLSKELGAEGDLDELDFEDEFADDEEKVEGEVEDEEAKEAEERLKRQYKTANKLRESYIDESEEEEEEPKLSMAGKDVQKLMRKLEKNLAYESDEEENPYASSEEEESEEEPPEVPQGPAIIPPAPKIDSRSASQAPPGANGVKPVNGGQPPLAIKTETFSRPTSPIASPGHGGHSIVAKRATSPKAPKGKPNGPSRATSPLAGGSRATSPVAGTGSRASSPAAQGPGVPAKLSNKRKATEELTSPTNGQGAPIKQKKRKSSAIGELDAQMLIEWLKVTANATTRDCIHHFSPYLKKDDEKRRFAGLVKEVAVLKDNVLTLRSGLRGKDAGGTPTPGSAPSPIAAIDD